MDENYSQIIDDVKQALCKVNCADDEFQDYISKLGPVISRLLPYYLSKSRIQYENTKNKDCDKYLYSPLENYFKNSGKMHRPCLCIAVFLMCGGAIVEVEKVLSVACAIEVFQAAALIHDDIADCAELRRGKPCFHVEEGIGVGLNAGDFGLAMVVGNVLSQLQNNGTPPVKIFQIVNQLQKMEYMTIEGQAIDLGWARDERFDISTNDYFTMARKKTAYYSCALPCVLGAICAGASGNIIAMLEEFGLQTGIAFQVQDDILNLTVPGDKDFLSDITEGKRTLLVVKALERCSKKDSAKLQKILTGHTKRKSKLKNAVKIIERSGSLLYAKKLTKELSDSAKQTIRRNYNNRWSDIVVSMSDWAINRDL